MHRALRYLVRTKLLNGLRAWARKLKTGAGLGGALAVVLLVVMLLADPPGQRDPAEQHALFTTVLGFFLWLGVLGGLGQRGLVFAPADLDFLLPAPFSRAELILYQFTSQYLSSAFMALVYVLLLGGFQAPAPGWLLVGAVLCLVVQTHLAAAATEGVMLLTDGFASHVRRASKPILIAFMIVGLGLLVASTVGWGDMPAHLGDALESDVVGILLFPAAQAANLGFETAWGPRLASLGALIACALVSFWLVLRVPAAFVENSFTASRAKNTRVERARRGVFKVGSARSRRMPAAALWRGAGALLWLNALTLRRKAHVLLGGLVVLLALLAFQFANRGERALGPTILALLIMLPLWMHLPVGIRLPREQLAPVRQFPVAPTPLAAALLAVPVLVIFGLQLLVIQALVVTGSLPPLAGLAILPAYLVATATFVAIDGVFTLGKADPTSMDVIRAVLQAFFQLILLLPGLVAFGAVQAVLGLEAGAVAGAAVQAIVATALVGSLGRRLQRRELPGA
jgi:hypothetical protein